MSSWKSRWSWVRLVKAFASKWIASARCSTRACEETSITHAASPASSIRAKIACRSIASGVVRSTSATSPPTTLCTVPSRPVRRPAASSSWRARKAVVVLPFVPVTPTTWSSAVGSPWKAAANGAIEARTSGTCTSGTPRSRGRSTTRADAPESTAFVRSRGRRWSGRARRRRACRRPRPCCRRRERRHRRHRRHARRHGESLRRRLRRERAHPAASRAIVWRAPERFAAQACAPIYRLSG